MKNPKGKSFLQGEGIAVQPATEVNFGDRLPKKKKDQKKGGSQRLKGLHLEGFCPQEPNSEGKRRSKTKGSVKKYPRKEGQKGELEEKGGYGK